MPSRFPGAMPVYLATLTIASFAAAVCAGFILASSPRQRATQLAASLAAGASWWALCEVRWNAATDPATVLLWMRLSTPGWCFIGAVVPHLMARYLDLFPAPSARDTRPVLLRFASFGYLVGGTTLLCSWLGLGIHGAPMRVPWGWSYVPGPALVGHLAAVSPGLVFTVAAMFRHLRSPLSVAPRIHRISIRIGVLLPVVMTPLTDIFLPLAGVPFPRLGSTAYALFGLVALGTGLRYGISFFTPRTFSEEILDTLQEGVALVTPRGLIRRANREFGRLAGCEVESLPGVALADLLDGTPPSGRDQVEGVQARLRRVGGDPVPVAVSSAPLRDQRGNRLGLVVVLRDLRELEEMRHQMLIQARLAAVGELVAGLAHEINNPLAYVRSNLALLERHTKVLTDPEATPEDERESIAQESRELIGESLVGVDRAVEIVRSVRRFTHVGSPVRVPADLNDLLADGIAMLRPRIEAADVEVQLEPGDIPTVSCAPQEMRQVFLNLLVNALDAVGARGRVIASTRVDDDGVRVEIRDDGCGMAPDTLERIFDPFFTTKTVGEGTGLGLGIAWNIVRSQGGHIVVRSEPGVGTRFEVRLPLVADHEEAAGGDGLPGR